MFKVSGVNVVLNKPAVKVLLMLLMVVILAEIFFQWRVKLAVQRPFEKNCPLVHKTDSNRQTLTLQQKDIDAVTVPTSTNQPSSITLKDKISSLKLKMSLSGMTFTGQSQKVTFDITTSLVHRFSPMVENHVKKMFITPTGSNSSGYLWDDWSMMSPAITWYKGQLITTMRLWFNQEKHWNDNTLDQHMNKYLDNYLYMQRFDENFNQLSSGSILGIPTPSQYIMNGGPGDPRLVKIGQKLFISFYMCMVINGIQTGHMYMWDFDENIGYKPDIQGYRLANVDSNWSPFDVNGTLHYVYMLDPLRVLKCNFVDGQLSCNWIYQTKGSESYHFDDSINFLRGGTPFILYQYPYYIAISHTTFTESESNHIYNIHLVVLKVDPFRIIYTSDPILVHEKLFENVPIVRAFAIKKSYVYPVGIIMEDADNLAIGVTVNDKIGVVLRITGVKSIIRKVIEIDRASSSGFETDINEINSYLGNAILVHNAQK